MDIALVKYINSICRKLAVTPARLHPHEVYMTEADLASDKYSCLRGKCSTGVILRKNSIIKSLDSTFAFSMFIPAALLSIDYRRKSN